MVEPVVRAGTYRLSPLDREPVTAVWPQIYALP
jgi:hypothetical protein